MPKITPVDMQARKREGRKITMLSVYDYPLALLADRAGLDSLLVGDSLAMTALGYPSTVPLKLEESLHHVKAVARAAKSAMVVADMPFMSYQPSERDAIIAAGRFLQIPAVDFGVAQLLLLPGESYVEFQLAAQRMRPDAFVCVAGYGDAATGYIPTDRHFAERDANLEDWCWVAPGSEARLLAAIRKALR